MRFQGVPENHLESQVVFVLVENGGPEIRPVEGVIDGSGFISACWPGHAPSLHEPQPMEKRIAVGMALAGHPPHGSVREGLPHTVLALSQARNRLALGQLSARCAVRITRVFRHRVRCEASGTTFLSAGSLPSSDSAGASAAPLFAVVVGVGSEGARRSAGPRPPLKPDNQFSRIRLSQRLR